MQIDLADSRTIVWKEFAGLRGKISIIAIIVGMVAFWCTNLAFIARDLEQRGAAADTLKVLADAVVSHYALSVSMIIFFLNANQVFHKERHTRTLESLLATPISPVSVWAGKTIFGVMGGLLFSVVLAIGGVVTLNVTTGVSEILIPNTPAVVFLVLLLPLLSCAICGLLGVINLLSSNSVLCNAAFFLLAMVYFGVSTAKVRSMLVTWETCGGCLVVCLSLLLVTRYLLRLLTCERVLLSLR
ncbi:MAG TPA: ABC transporter permease [Bryobacteraceae bacterium]|nr:ABC transporter permease [Bryobacteraceae bacterium]HPU74282.1 ABC transporter permease [Bryobacteraceae bacterium]